MSFGLTENGFVLKTFAEVKAEIIQTIRDRLGNTINVLPTESLGQLIDIFSERESILWETLEDVYNSFDPDTAIGVSLDKVVAITGIKRLEATKGTGTGKAFGTLGTIITAGSIVSVEGNPDARFVVTENAEIAAGTNEVQDVDFSAVPDAGNWTLRFDGEETGTLAFNDNAAAVQAALNALPNLSAVTVSGNYTTGFTVTFAGVDGSIDQPMLLVGTNTLTNTGIQVNISIVETTKGVLPNVVCNLEAETAGVIPAYASTLTVIETPIAGWDSFINEADIVEGTEIETDAELRLRRNLTLSTAGAATVDSIRARILEIPEVDQARVFENDTDTTDGFGRPPHSFEAVVVDGDDQDIADAIWAVKPAGIASFGGDSATVTDSMGFPHTVYFSRPDPIDIYVLVDNLVTDDDYPVDGDDAIKQAIVDFTDEEFGIGDDVIFNRLHCAIAEIQGVIDYDLFIATTPAPAATANISIAEDEISSFDTANITVQT